MPTNACDPEILSTIDFLVYHFYQRHGGDVDELRSEAYYQTLLAKRSFDGRGQRPRWIYYKVKKALCNTIQQRRRRPGRFSQEIPLEQIQDRERMRWPHFLAELSDDARNIVQLLVGEQLQCLLPRRMRGRKIRPSSRLDVVVNFLLEVGWTGKEILKSLGEIKEAL